MKIVKFKSLTMRIWTIFTAIILIIICSISFLYLFAYRNINENARMQDLMVAHGILLNSSDFNQADMFNELKNLKGSSQFLVTISGDTKQISDIVKRLGSQSDFQNNSSTESPKASSKDWLRNFIQNPASFQAYNVKDAESWMAGYINGETIYEKEFRASFQGRTFIFIISSIDNGNSDQSFLVSYMPDMEDNRLLYIVTGVGIVFIFIGFITAKIVAGHIAKPLKELEDFTVRIARKDWKEPILIKSQDEIGRLANAMNRMQKELKLADEEEKMFLQSISHDLKTPVMVIMSHAAAIIDGVYVDSVENTAEIIRDEALSLEKKIKQMLYLNTLDYIMVNNTEFDKVNLHDLLLHIINRFEVVNSEIEWDLDIDKVTINGNTDKMQVAIENILDNALRYVKNKICISLKEERSYAVLEIYNDGPNIDPKNIDHIFDNLYKDKTGNFGLGLAISKKIIDFYNGEIKAVNKENGVSFIIKYPV
jgi:two-component system, OmpR family, sensor histidine kinase CssS